MPTPLDGELVVLLALRLHTLADEATVATTTGLPVDQVSGVLQELADAGLVRERDGRVRGWMLLAPGRDAVTERLASELDASGARPAVTDAYRRFLTVNQDLLDLCTRWQVRVVDGVEAPNDHADADHDGAVLAGLAAVDEVGQATCQELRAALDRFSGYGTRLADARRQVEAGETGALTGPSGSYHSTWFELHENLLVTLGLERGHAPLEPTTPLQEVS